MSHRIDILRALANDPAATPGERAAALQALAIHEAREVPASTAAAPEPAVGEDAEVLLLFADVPAQAVVYFRDFVQRRRSPISVVITASMGAWMFAPAACTRVSFTPSTRRHDLFSLELEIWAERESEKFKAASQRALPQGKLALASGR